MRKVVYIERAVQDHPRTLRICKRMEGADIVICDRYSEVFNPRSQNFRSQKRNPCLILARKNDGFVLPAPPSYGLGGDYNFYFSHMLNCLYDCRYCFLQGMFRSANLLLYVNYEDFQQAIRDKITECGDRAKLWFFSGYDCDSLAYEPVSKFAGDFLHFFERYPNAWFELRTKSTQVRALHAREPLANVLVAFSFTPENVSAALERNVPSVETRLNSMAGLQAAGWPLGLRFDPLIFEPDFQINYEKLISRIFSTIDPESVVNVSLGSFRMPKSFFKNVVKQYPDEPFLAGPLQLNEEGQVEYEFEIKKQMLDYVTSLLLQWVPADRLFNHEQSLQNLEIT